MLLGKKGIVGLDIGSNAIKLVELSSGKKSHQLKNVGEAPIPNGSIVNKSIADPGAVAQALSSLISDLKVKTRNVAISISGHSVIIKKVSLPKMSDVELRESIPWELEQYIPQSIDEVNYDYQVMPGETPEGNVDVLIVAAKKDVTSDYLNVVRDVGLNPVVVDVDAFALENAYEMNYTDTAGLLALINIGASITNINIINDGVSIFTRDITTGGNQYTDWIIKETGVSYEEAENMKNSASDGQESADLERIGNDFNELVCGEIKRTLDFFSNTLWKDKVSSIVIGGGSSKVPGIRETLADMAESEVSIMNPFRNVTINKNEFDPEYIDFLAPKMNVSVGLALRRPGDK